MMIKKDPLLDKVFLKELDKQKHKEIFAKVISLNFKEQPIEEITGCVTSGSINLDGKSAVRRTCSLSIACDPSIELNDFYWGLKTKVKIFIGVKNNTNSEYPDIIWFPQGLYILTSFQTSHSINSYNINLQGKDKMCLLNGDLSGSITSLTWDFGEMDVVTIDENGETQVNKEKILIKDIIKNAVHEFAGEPFDNIIINDLDMCGLNLLTYMGSEPIFLFRDEDTKELLERVAIGNNSLTKQTRGAIKYNSVKDQYIISHDQALLGIDFEIDLTPVGRDYLIQTGLGKGEKNYLKTELGYTPFRLSDKDSIYSRLNGQDKLYNTSEEIIGEFPGNFVFTLGSSRIGERDVNEQLIFNPMTGDLLDQEDKTYTIIENIPLTDYFLLDVTPLGDDPNTIPLSDNGIVTYYDGRVSIIKFERGDTAGYQMTDLVYGGNKDGSLMMNVGDSITAMLDKIVSMLGEYEYFYDLDGHFVFQQKKTYVQTTWNNTLTNSNEDDYYEAAMNISARSYDFSNTQLLTSVSNQPNLLNIRNDFVVWGSKKTSGGTEQSIHYRYAIDKKPIYYKNWDGQVFIPDKGIHMSRERVINNANKFLKKNYNIDLSLENDSNINIVDWRELIYQMAIDHNSHNGEKNFSKQLSLNNSNLYTHGRTGYEQYYTDLQGFWRDYLYEYDVEDKVGGFKADLDKPDELRFWFDFLDTDGAIAQFGVTAIGDRTKAIKDDSTKAIYYREVPNILYQFGSENSYKIPSEYFRLILSDEYEGQFQLSTQGKSAQEVINNMIYNYSYSADQITLNSLPIYYLEPNVRIYIHDEESHVEGDYAINKISIQLAHGGTMQIVANRIPEEIV